MHILSKNMPRPSENMEPCDTFCVSLSFQALLLHLEPPKALKSWPLPSVAPYRGQIFHSETPYISPRKPYDSWSIGDGSPDHLNVLSRTHIKVKEKLSSDHYRHAVALPHTDFHDTHHA